MLLFTCGALLGFIVGFWLACLGYAKLEQARLSREEGLK